MSKNEQGTILKRDPRKGRRVLFLADLPESVLYGTIEQVIRFPYGDGFLVAIQRGMHINGNADDFALLEPKWAEWYPGDRIQHNFDRKTATTGTVTAIHFFNYDISIAIQFDDGQKVSLPPYRLEPAR